ncbi:MAG: hypothetical protein JOZ38_12315 [Candidatus Eremiobacteraeota bacterium]|nr:hypothetical protein [Candidatus Eremiobacteraeota bacterium]
MLGTISASFRAEAAEVTSAYGAALSQGGPERWSRFVSAAFALGRHGAELESLIGLAARERAAWRVFARIADENADLLETPALATA